MAGYDLGTARGRIEIDASSLGRATGGLDKMGKSLVVLGAVGAAAFVGVVKTAADFEKILSAVGAVSDATSKQMDQLRDTALQLGLDTQYSASEIASSMEDLAKAGISVEDITNGAAKATANLAAAAGDELPGGISQGAEIIANAMKTFDASAKDLDHFADVLVGAAASSTLNVEDLATSLKYTGPIAHELGISLDDLSAALAILGDRGIKGSTAGTSLRGVLLSLTPSSKKAFQAMQNLGYVTEDGTNNFYDMAGSLKPLPQIMEIMQKGLVGLSQKEKIAAYNAIFQRRAMNSALILAGQGAKGFDKYAAAIGKISAKDIAKKKLDNLAGAMEKLKSSAETFLIKAGTPLLGMLKNWTLSITRFVNWLTKMDAGILSTVVKVVAIASAISLALGAGLLFISMLLKMYRAFIDVKAALVLVRGMLSTTFLANPVFLVIAAIVALGVALYVAYQKSETFRRIVDKMIDGVQEFIKPLQPAIDFLKSMGEELGRIVRAFLRGSMYAEKFGLMMDSAFGGGGRYVAFFISLYNGVKKVFDYIGTKIIPVAQKFLSSIDWGDTLKKVGIVLASILSGGILPLAVGLTKLYQNNETFRNGVQGFVSFLQTELFPVLKMFWDLLWQLGEIIVAVAKRTVPIFAAALRLIVQVIKSVVSVAINIWKLFGDNLLSLIKIAWSLIANIVRNGLQIIKGIIQVISGLISGDWGKAWEGIKNIVGGAWDLIYGLIFTAKDLIVLAFQTLVDAIHLVWDTGWEFIKQIVPAAWNVILQVIKGVGTAIVNVVKHIIDLIISPFKNLYDVLVGHSIIPDLMEKMRTIIKSGLEAVLRFFKELPGKVIGFISGLASDMLAQGKSWLSQLSTGVTSGWLAVSTFFAGIPGRIIALIGTVGKLLYDTGKNILQGLINGLEDKFNDLKNMVSKIGNLVKDGIGAVLNLGSPSRLMHQYGEWTVEGFINGLAKSMPGIEKQFAALDSMVGKVGPTLTPGLGTGSSANKVEVNFNFTGTFGEGSEEAIKNAVSQPSLLREIISAAKAGA